jgi:hypothetical protein
MRRAVITTILVAASFATINAADLYKVTIGSEAEAARLRALDVKPVFALPDGYLVLIEHDRVPHLETADIDARFIAADQSIERLSVGRTPQAEKDIAFPIIYSEGNFRLYAVDVGSLGNDPASADLLPLRNNRIQLIYRQPYTLPDYSPADRIGLDSLISLVSRDTIESSMQRMEDFHGRLTGTDSCYAARDWLAARFRSFGYDSVVVDSFTGFQLWARVPVPSQNVVAIKRGAKYPDAQIIVGGHFDVVPDCPGADDNASGTIGTLEIARILSTLDMDMTFVFIAFDSEESWLWGSQHYADEAYARGENIVYMMNLDMIGNLPNNSGANLYYGSETAYAELWRLLADSLVGISAKMAGSTASDHLPFQDYGYPVTFVQEGIFSSEYHCYSGASDDIYHINFEYMTRMVKASLATVYTIDGYPAPPPPVMITSVSDVGDGQSLQVAWQTIACDRVDHLELHYGIGVASQMLLIPPDSTGLVLAGLTEGAEYIIYMKAIDTAGTQSLVLSYAFGTPLSRPRAPENLTAWPLRDSVRLEWTAENHELDFSHYAVMRDGVLLPDATNNTDFLDDDPSLGTTLHQYRVRAVDFDGNLSDTIGIAPVAMKAAALEAGRILAVNRSHRASSGIVDEMMTGQFLQEALDGFNFDYYSDTAFSSSRSIGLLDMIDYGILVLGGESGRNDNFGQDPLMGGILDHIGYYLMLGGKVLVFGRWGDIFSTGYAVDTIFFAAGQPAYGYAEYFNIASRVLPLTHIYSDGGQTFLSSDLVGAHGRAIGYPDLIWDSTVTMHHTGVAFAGVSGIPCPSFPILGPAPIDTLYTYDSGVDSTLTEGRVIGWRSLGGPYEYVFFEFPLTFMNHDAAVTALQQAIFDLGIPVSVDDDPAQSARPNTFALMQNYPNPFNPATTIQFQNPEARPIKATVGVYNILGQRVRQVFDDLAQPGMTKIVWDGLDESGRAVASGIYLYRLRIDTTTLTRKMILLK